jgi:signal transduction histidine kinase/CheY-like chemotaxis protein/HPt (histidine-containing phosphotransfer) domain-containing protein
MGNIQNIKLFDNINNGVCALSEDLRVEYWNEWLSVNTGIKSDDITGKHIHDFFTDMDTEKLKRKMNYAKMLKSPSYYHAAIDKYLIPIHFKRLTGRKFDRMRQDVVITYLTDYSKYLCVIYDNTSYLEIERKLQDNNSKLEDYAKLAQKYSESKSAFLANTSHELRTPLNSLLGFIELLKTTELTKEQTDYLNIIHDSSYAMLDIVNTVMGISEAEKGIVAFKPAECSIMDTVRAATELFYAKAFSKRINLTCYIDPNIPVKLYADCSKIRQILLNFISNSIKFTPETGFVDVAAKLMKIKDGKAYIEFSVEDTGAGISEEFQKKIFVPYEREDTGIYFEGTGIGMHICAQFAELMGSRISLRSTVGEGSRFSFVLAADIINSATYAEETDIKDISITVLTMDSQDSMSRVIISYLDAVNASYSVYSSAEEIPQDKNPDVLLVAGCVNLCSNSFAVDELPAKKVICFSRLKCNKEHEVIRNPKIITYRGIFDPKSIYLCISDAAVEITHSYSTDKKRVLVMEDNPNNQKLMKVILEKMNCEVDLAINGEAGFILFKQYRYDLIFIDINMPVKNGRETITAIKEYSSSADIALPRIYALTAHILDDVKNEYLSMGFDGYLKKPVRVDTIKNLLTDLKIGGRQSYLPKPAAENKVEFIRKNMEKFAELEWENIQSLLEMFLGSIFTELSDLSRVARSESRENLKKKAHYLKGQCMSFYLEKETAILSRIEYEDLSLDELNSLINDLKNEISILEQQYSEYEPSA